MTHKIKTIKASKRNPVAKELPKKKGGPMKDRRKEELDKYYHSLLKYIHSDPME